MKVRFIPNWGIELVGENDDEKNLLNHFDADFYAEGILVSGRGHGKIILCSPKMADSKQLHLAWTESTRTCENCNHAKEQHEFIDGGEDWLHHCTVSGCDCTDYKKNAY